MRTFSDRARSTAARGRAFVTALATAIATCAVPFLVVTLVSEPVADAMLAKEVSLRELVTAADLVVEATPVESHSVWEDTGASKRIVTYTRLEIAQVIAGDTSGDVWVRTLGGIVGNIGQRVEGEAVLEPNERCVLFLKALPTGNHAVVDMAQGHFPVRPVDGAMKLHPSPQLGGVIVGDPAKSARVALVGKVVADAVSLIKSERKAAGR